MWRDWLGRVEQTYRLASSGADGRLYGVRFDPLLICDCWVGWLRNIEVGGVGGERCGGMSQRLNGK